jgi:hypothetical protein
MITLSMKNIKISKWKDFCIQIQYKKSINNKWKKMLNVNNNNNSKNTNNIL